MDAVERMLELITDALDAERDDGPYRQAVLGGEEVGVAAFSRIEGQPVIGVELADGTEFFIEVKPA